MFRYMSARLEQTLQYLGVVLKRYRTRKVCFAAFVFVVCHFPKYFYSIHFSTKKFVFHLQREHLSTIYTNLNSCRYVNIQREFSASKGCSQQDSCSSGFPPVLHSHSDQCFLSVNFTEYMLLFSRQEIHTAVTQKQPTFPHNFD